MTAVEIPCRLIMEAVPQSGVENMHTDEDLLRRVTENDTVSFVRIYRWAEPTVSLGYFQSTDSPVDARMQSCPRVRRITGGGAILHDATEITYCCAIPASHPLRPTPTRLYEVVHAAIVQWMRDCGANAHMRTNAPQESRSTSDGDIFLCFLRTDPRDVVIGQDKVLGSAQRRRRGNILQHGSILLKSSPLTPEIPGITDLCSQFREMEFCRELGLIIRDAIRVPNARQE
jgi:lipoate-protein ligase A